MKGSTYHILFLLVDFSKLYISYNYCIIYLIYDNLCIFYYFSYYFTLL